MSETNTSRNFYCNSEQLIQLDLFKNKVKSINKDYGEELQEVLFANNKDDYTKYMFSNSDDIIERLFKEEEVEFIDYVTTDINLNNSRPSISFRIFNKINELKLIIDDGLIKIDERIKEGWAVIKIELKKDKNINSYFLKNLELLPTQIKEEDLQSYFNIRKKYSLSDWTNLILNSLGFSPSTLTFKEKFTILARVIPYCQENFSLLELGSKGTGKSTFYEDFSNEKVEVFTGSVSAATLFYNNTGHGSPGEITRKEVIAIDEISNMTFEDEAISNYKSYLEKGVFNRGKEKVHSGCSISFLGNYDNFHEASNNPERILDSIKNPFFRDTAIISRLSFISYGWEVQPFSKSSDIPDKKILQIYLIKFFQSLRKHDFNKLIEEKINFHSKLNERDKKNIIKVVSGFLKLLHPNQIVRDKELIAYVEIAIENLKYKVTLKKFFENSNNIENTERKSEYTLPTPIYVPKNENYKNNIELINKEFMLYNYIDWFKSNYSLQDFIIKANEFDSDNGNNNSINFFPINKAIEEKRETKLIGNVLTIDHPYIKNEKLNIGISLTGAYENEKKVEFYNKLKEKNSNFLSLFEEPGHFSDNSLILSSKINVSPNNNIYSQIHIIDFVSEFIPYYPKQIYLSTDFQQGSYFINYSNFYLIKKLNSKINIISVDYIINEEKYDISYYELAQPVQNTGMAMQQPHFNPQQNNQDFFTQLVQIQQMQNSFNQPSTMALPSFGLPNTQPIKKSLNIEELIDLLEEKNS